MKKKKNVSRITSTNKEGKSMPFIVLDQFSLQESPDY